MRSFLSILLPATVLAQSMPIGNPSGTTLGIFGMCGTDPVDCGNGWCCLAGQKCTSGPNGENTMCSDSKLFDRTGKAGVVVNGAYFGKMQQHQVTPGNNSTTSKTTTNSSKSKSNGSSKSVSPASVVMVSAIFGAVTIALSSI